MPRKFQDGQQVAVYYRTRRMHENFFGRIEKYEDGLYHVRYLAGNKRPRNDLVFACKVHELCSFSSEFYQSMTAQLAATYNDMLRSFASERYHYRHSDIQLTWLSYAVKRLRDNDFTRKFPISETVWRISRVY
tara:strand:+ start:202 stop:600 length:399 start_codon:yes stop_codon:yes gene_type:complete